VALTRINPDHFADKSSLVKHLLLGAQNPDRRHYDLIIECTGGTSAQINIDLATELLAKEGVLVLFGVTDEPISLDLSAVVAKKLFLMGTYRARLETYRSALSFIVEHQRIREALDSIIDCGTIINGQSKFHDIRDSKHLAEVFRAADNRNEALGRILIRHLSPTFMSSMEPARWVLPSSLVPTLGLPASLHRKDKSTPCASPV
jgi:threonine dehydrogenase-like Zn-dependent dehydrogenase